MDNIDEPMNPTERYLHGINVRLDALIHMFSSFLEVYAQQNKMAVTSETVEEAIPLKKSRKR